MEIQADLHLAEREERVGREDGSVSAGQQMMSADLTNKRTAKIDNNYELIC